MKHNRILLIWIVLSACQSQSISRINDRHVKNHLKEKSFILDYTIRRYQEYSTDTMLFNVMLYYKYVSDSSAAYINETIQVFKRYSNNSQAFSDTLYKDRKQFSLFANGRELYCMQGEGNDTAYKTERRFTGNPFNAFPFWINRHLLDAGSRSRFCYDPGDDTWKDTFRHISVRFKNYTPVFASNALLGTVSRHKNEFYFTGYKEITTRQFDSQFYAYEQLMADNADTSRDIPDDTLPSVAVQDIKIFNYDSKTYGTLNVKDTCLVLLDFSYVRCFPCVMVMPAIDSIRKKYAGVLKTYTLDPMDKYPKDSMLLNHFVQKYGISGSLYLCDMSVTYPKAFNVRAFPTIFLINREGEVVFVQKGFSTDLYESLDKVIIENIYKK